MAEISFAKKNYFTTEIISARQINNHGIGWANKQIFRRLIKKVPADKYIVDGNLKLGRLNGKTRFHRDVFVTTALKKLS